MGFFAKKRNEYKKNAIAEIQDSCLVIAGFSFFTIWLFFVLELSVSLLSVKLLLGVGLGMLYSCTSQTSRQTPCEPGKLTRCLTLLFIYLIIIAAIASIQIFNDKIYIEQIYFSAKNIDFFILPMMIACFITIAVSLLRIVTYARAGDSVF